MTIDDIRTLIVADESRTLELKKTTGELKDGTYKVEAKVGGSSRTSITCEKVEVKDGKATARIVFSSAGYPKLWVNVNGTVKEYEKRTDSAAGTSAIDIPVDINKEMNVIGYVGKDGILYRI
mgnify:CR=1 FL=1